MRLFFSVLLLLFLVESGHAFVFKGVLGYRVSSIQSLDKNYLVDAGFILGIRKQHFLTPVSSLRMGFNYTEIIVKWSENGNKYKGGVSYLDASLWGSYFLNKKTNVFAGFTAGYFLSKQCEGENITCTLEAPSRSRTAFSVGAEYNINKQLGVELLYEYNFGSLSTTFKKVSGINIAALVKF